MKDALLELGAEANVPLAEYSWVKVGGRAEWFFEAERTTDLATALILAQARNLPVTLLGGGANILIADAGVKGLTIQLAGDFCRIVPVEKEILRAGAGARIVDLAKAFQAENRTGMEWSIGIPGTIGGAVFMNAGIPEGCMADVVESVEVVAPTGEIHSLTRADAKFGYRSSRFQTSGEIVASAVVRMGQGPWKKAWAKELTEYRTTRQPYREPNFGSVFRNPEGDHAARLIEAAGLKGFRIGNAAISALHANFIVNLGGATARDIRGLIRTAQERVREKFGVELETEVRYLGDHAAEGDKK